jgi:hypothetical protein
VHRSIITAIALLALTGTAGAQEEKLAPTPTPTETSAPPPAPAKLYYLEVEGADLDIISRGLMEVPKRLADPLILKLNGQLQAQDKIVAKAKPDSAGALVEPTKKGKKPWEK